MTYSSLRPVVLGRERIRLLPGLATEAPTIRAMLRRLS